MASVDNKTKKEPRAATSPMNGIYIARLDIAKPEYIGVCKKIEAQLKAFGEYEAKVDLFCLRSSELLCNSRILKKAVSGRIRNKLRHYAGFYAYLAHANLTTDFFYIRYQKCDPFFIYMIAALKFRFPSSRILIEIPSYPYEQENKSIRNRILLFTDRSTRWMLRFFVKNIITFSQATRIFGIQTIRITNGVEIRSINPVTPPDSSDTFRLVGLANVSYWHGYDRVISGLAQYYSNSPKRKVLFDIIGDGAEISKLKCAVKLANLQDYVIFHGTLIGDSLEKTLSQCHMGVSSIGLHRHGMDSSTIKSAEFCAAGIPFIMSRRDTCLPQDTAFVHRVCDSDKAVNISQLLDFYMQLRESQPSFNIDMRSYAEKHISWNNTLKPVITSLGNNHHSLPQ